MKEERIIRDEITCPRCGRVSAYVEVIKDRSIELLCLKRHLIKKVVFGKAEVELSYGEKRIKLKCLVDTGASRSVISKKLANELRCFLPLRKPYELGTAEKEGRLRIVGSCLLEGVVFQGAEVPGRILFEVAENLREDVDLVVGRPEIDAWDVIFTPKGPRPRRVPIKFEII